TTVGASLDWYTGAQQALQSGSTTFNIPAGLPISASGKVESAQFFQPFAGLEAGNGKLAILAEYRPKLEKDGLIYNSAVMSLAVRKKLTTGITATVGMTNFNIPYTDSDLGVFADLGFHFGL
ncbi:MAG TPA: hypothetical protein VGM23_15230, partial [Armatimonadota bacterium]